MTDEYVPIGSPMMHVVVVVNCGAGSADDDATADQRREIVEAFSQVQVDADVRFVRGPSLADAFAAAAGERPDAVVVAGGDGSIGAAVAALTDGDVALGVLPLGTFNHFAKDIGMPLDLVGAAAAIAGGRVSRVDVAELDGRFFVNNSSVGVYPIMVSARDRIREARGWGKLRAAPVAMWKVLRRFPVRRITITADGYSRRLRTPFVFVGNNRYDVGPRGVGQRTRIDAGELCVFVARAGSPWRLLWIAAKATIRGSSRVAELDEMCVPAVTLDAHGHRLQVSLDGETVTLRSPLRYRIRPAALPLLAVPAPGPTTGALADASGADAQPGRAAAASVADS